MSVPAVFPIGHRGHIELQTHAAADLDSMAVALEDQITTKSPRSIGRAGSIIEFEAGMFGGVAGWSAFTLIRSGHIELKRTAMGIKVDYQIYFTETLLLLAVLSAVVAAMGGGARDASITWVLGNFLGMWAWGSCVIAITAIVMFPRFLRRALLDPGHAV